MTKAQSHRGYCSVDGCANEAKRYGGLCWGHTKRKQRGLVVNVLLAEPEGRTRGRWAAVLKAVRRFSDEETQAATGRDARLEFERIENTLRRAIYRYVAPSKRRKP